jgi:hypothetical protein
MTAIPKFDILAFEQVQSYVPSDTSITPTIKKIVTYVSPAVKDVKIGDEITVYPSRRFTYYDAQGRLLFFVSRQDVNSVIPKTASTI